MDLEKKSTKFLILEKARILFAEEGYAGASMNTLAKLVNIAKPSIYHFFHDKESLYIQVIEEAFSEVENVLLFELGKDVSDDEKLHNLIYSYLEFGMKEENKHIHMIMSAQKVPSSEIRILNLIEKLSQEKVRKYFEILFQNKSLLINIPARDSKLASFLLIKLLNAFILDEKKDENWTAEKTAKLIAHVYFEPR